MPERRAHVGQRVVGRGRLDQRLVDRAGAGLGQLVEPGDRPVVERVELGVGGALGGQHVVDQHDPLAPVVVGHQLADHRHDGVGVAEVVGRHGGQVLDLAHDVVAEVADHAAVQRRQVGQRRRPPRGEQDVERREDALVAGHLGRDRAGDVDLRGRGR